MARPGEDDSRDREMHQASQCLTVLGLYSTFESVRCFPDLKGSKVNNESLQEFKRAVEDGVLQFVARMSPRDELERLTLEQLAFQHLRAINLGRTGILAIRAGGNEGFERRVRWRI